MEQKKGKLAVISGFSGVGKGTVVRKLLEKYPYELSVSATTRSPRPGEVDGVSYFFITEEEFEQMIAEDGFFEWARYVEHYYGTPKQFVFNKLAEGKDVILEIETVGALKVKDAYPEAMLIFMLPPSMETLARRLRGRGTESEEVISKRLRKAALEVEKISKYDYIIVNDQLDECVEELNHMIQTGEGTRPEDSELLKQLTQEAAPEEANPQASTQQKEPNEEA